MRQMLAKPTAPIASLLQVPLGKHLGTSGQMVVVKVHVTQAIRSHGCLTCKSDLSNSDSANLDLLVFRRPLSMLWVGKV